jgi:valyl-tRNA synthetase
MLETGWDILFFWVARMVMLGIKLTGTVPFTEVYCHPLVRDAQGRKMSKSLGNVIDPIEVMEGSTLDALHQKLLNGNLDSKEITRAKADQKRQYPSGIPECGTDALRFGLCGLVTGGRDLNLNVMQIRGHRQFVNKFYQATRFALMNYGEYVPERTGGRTGRETLVEKWILHRFNEAARMANDGLEAREFHKSTNAIYVFWLYQLCDVYIVWSSDDLELTIGKFKAVDARWYSGAEEVCARYISV